MNFPMGDRFPDIHSKIQNLYLSWLRHHRQFLFELFLQILESEDYGTKKNCFPFSDVLVPLTFSMIPSFICSWIILSYSPTLLDQIKFFVRLCNLPRLFTSLFCNGQ